MFMLATLKIISVKWRVIHLEGLCVDEVLVVCYERRKNVFELLHEIEEIGAGFRQQLNVKVCRH